jgi:cbb3-type cytochrome oxidase cytochrome c subunit
MQTLGVPYSDADVERGARDARAEGERIAHDLRADVVVEPDSQLVALVAYLQRLGRAQPRHPVERAPEGGEDGDRIRVSQAGGAR